MKIGYALMLNREAHNFIRKIQLELHQKIGIGLARQAPHITIKSPFEVSAVVPHIGFLRALANRTPPFEVELKGFQSFSKQVLFLDVVANETLLHLHHDILQEVKTAFGEEPHEFEGKHIKFHASIAGFQGAVDYEAAQEYLSDYQPHFRFKAHTFGLFYYLGPGNGWIVNSYYDLGDE